MHSTLLTNVLVVVLCLGGILGNPITTPTLFHDLQARAGRGGPAKGDKGVGSGIGVIGGAAGAGGRGGASGSGWGQVSQSGSKDIIDPRTLRYSYFQTKAEERWVTGEGWTQISVYAPGKVPREDIPLDKLAYDKNGATMVVFQAWNANDKAESRIPLRGILLSIWKTEVGAPLKDLRHIRYENVAEDSVLKAVDDAYAAMGRSKGESTPLTVRAGGTSPGEQEAFRKLATSNPFGVGAQKMMDDYTEMAGRQITGFTVKAKDYVWVIVDLD